MIRMVGKYRYTREHPQVRARGHYEIVVYYENRHRRFKDTDTLPMTVVDYMLNAKRVVTQRNEYSVSETYLN